MPCRWNDLNATRDAVEESILLLLLQSLLHLLLELRPCECGNGRFCDAVVASGVVVVADLMATAFANKHAARRTPSNSIVRLRTPCF